MIFMRIVRESKNRLKNLVVNERLFAKDIAFLQANIDLI